MPPEVRSVLAHAGAQVDGLGREPEVGREQDPRPQLRRLGRPEPAPERRLLVTCSSSVQWSPRSA